MGALSAMAQPCLNSWSYRQTIEVDNTTGLLLSGHQAAFTVNTQVLVANNKMQIDGGDIRFTNETGSVLPHWIETGTMNTSSTILWVKLDNIAAASSDDIYFFYGNSGATDIASGDDTFEYFDDFDGVAIDAAKWNTCGAGSAVVAGGELTLSSAAIADESFVLTATSSVSSPVVMESDVISLTNGQSYFGLIDNANNGYGISHEVNGLPVVLLREINSNGGGCYELSDVSTPANQISLTANSIAGTWSLGWYGSANQYFQWPGLAGKQERTDNEHNLTASVTPTFGHINQGTLNGATTVGSIKMDWIRVRKYTTTDPTLNGGTEAVMVNEVTASSNQPICQNADLNLLAEALSGAIFSWAGPNGFTSTDQNPTIASATLAADGDYTVTATVPSGCFSVSSTVTVQIDPLTVAGTLAGATTLCSATNSGTLTLSGQTGSVLRWESSPTENGPYTTINNTTTTLAYDDLTSATYYRAIVQNGSCDAAISNSQLLNVNQVTATSSDVCEGDNLNLFAISVTGATYAWTGPNGFTSTDQNPVIAASLPAASGTYTVTADLGTDCDAATASVTITVAPSSVSGTISGGAEVCNGSNSGTLTLSGNTGSVIRWESSSTNNGPWSTITNATLNLTYLDLNESTYFRTIVKSGVCDTVIAVPALIRMNELVVTATAVELCEASTLELFASSIAGATYQWTGPNGFTSALQNPTIANATTLADGIYTVTATQNTGCDDLQRTIDITINPATVAGSIAGANDVCFGGNSGTLTLSGHTGDIVRWESAETNAGPWINISNQTTTISFSDLITSTYFRTIIKSGVCDTLVTPYAFIEVVPIEVTAPEEVCEGSDISFTATTVASATYAWTGPNGFTSTNQNPLISAALPAASGIYTVSVSETPGCDAVTKSIDVLVSPTTISGTLSGADTVCYQTNTGTLSLAGNTGEVIRWETAPTPDGQWTTISNTTVTLSFKDLITSTYFRVIVKSGICDTAISNSQLIKIDETTLAGDISGAAEVCSKDNDGKIMLSNFVGEIIRWESSQSNNGTYTAIAETNDTLAYTNLVSDTYYRAVVQNNTCVLAISASVYIQVDENTDAGLLTGAAQVCDDTNSGTLSLSGYVGDIVMWQQSLNGVEPWIEINSTQENLTYTDLRETTHYRVLVKNGTCNLEISNTVAIEVSTTSVGGNIIGQQTVCFQENTGQLILNDFHGDIQRWEQRDVEVASWTALVSTGDTLNYSGLMTSTYYRAVVKSGVCDAVNSDSILIVVAPLPVLSFESDTVCLGLETSFTNLTTIPLGQLEKYLWDFGDGRSSILKDPKHTFSRSGFHTIQLKVTSRQGCLDSLTQQIFVDALPEVIYDVANVCQEFTTTFEPSVNIAFGSIATYSWDFADGNDSTTTVQDDIVYRYDTTGIYETQLTVTSNRGCITVEKSEVTIFPRATVLFMADSVYKGQETRFENNSYISTGNLSYLWSFGDGNTSTDFLPRYTYAVADTFNVRLITRGSYGQCTDTLIQEYIVHDQVVARFDVPNVCADDSARFINQSFIDNGTITYLWDFGDGTTSIEETPSHKYDVAGIYAVKIEATANLGSTDQYSKFITIYPEPKSVYTTASVCDADSARFQNLSSVSQGRMTWLWDFGEGTTSTVETPYHTFPSEGDFNVLLETTTAFGCRDSITQVFTVYPAPVPLFTVDTICHTFTSEFVNLSSISSGIIDSYSWKLGDGSNSIEENPTKIYEDPGLYPVTLTTISDLGCIRDYTENAKVLVNPIAAFEVEDVCFQETSEFVNRSIAGEGQASYRWELGDSTSSILTDVNKIYGNFGIYDVDLFVTTSFGCQDSIKLPAEVFALPSIIANIDQSTSKGYSVALMAEGGVDYFWSPGEFLDNEFIANPIATPLSTTIYEVLGIDMNGCEGTDQTRVTVIDDFVLVPSNIITPDANQINDNWYVENMYAYPEAEVSVFNLWGQRVFRTSAYNNDWEGVFNTDILPEGDYFYTISSPNHNKVYRGTLTLLRQ